MKYKGMTSYNTTSDRERRNVMSLGVWEGGGGRGVEDSAAYERRGDALRKFWVKPLQETDLGVAQAFFDP